MTNEQLIKANEIKNQINQTANLLDYVSKDQTLKSMNRKQRRAFVKQLQNEATKEKLKKGR